MLFEQINSRPIRFPFWKDMSLAKILSSAIVAVAVCKSPVVFPEIIDVFKLLDRYRLWIIYYNPVDYLWTWRGSKRALIVIDAAQREIINEGLQLDICSQDNCVILEIVKLKRIYKIVFGVPSLLSIKEDRSHTKFFTATCIISVYNMHLQIVVEPIEGVFWRCMDMEWRGCVIAYIAKIVFEIGCASIEINLYCSEVFHYKRCIVDVMVIYVEVYPWSYRIGSDSSKINWTLPCTLQIIIVIRISALWYFSVIFNRSRINLHFCIWQTSHGLACNSWTVLCPLD